MQQAGRGARSGSEPTEPVQQVGRGPAGRWGSQDRSAVCQGPVGSARWRTVELPVRGQQNCPAAARCSARSSVGQRRHPLAGGGYRTYLLARPAHQPAPTPTSPARPTPARMPTDLQPHYPPARLPTSPTHLRARLAYCPVLPARRPPARCPPARCPPARPADPPPDPAAVDSGDQGPRHPAGPWDRGPVRPIKRSGVSRSRRRGDQAWASEIGVPAQTIPPTHHPTGPGPYSDSGSSIPSALTLTLTLARQYHRL